VTDLGKQETRSRLDKAGFRVAVRFQGSSREDADRVLEQSVAGGKQAREGSKIELTVSGGRGVAKVPDLVGLTYSEAEGSWSNRATCWGRERDPERYRARGRYRGAEPEGRDHAGSGILRVTHDQHRAACGDDHRVLEPIASTEASYASASINATVTAFQVARISAKGKSPLVLQVSLKWFLGRAQIVSNSFRRPKGRSCGGMNLYPYGGFPLAVVSHPDTGFLKESESGRAPCRVLLESLSIAGR